MRWRLTLVLLAIAGSMVASGCGGDEPLVRHVDAGSSEQVKPLGSVGANIDAGATSAPPTTSYDSAEGRLLTGAPDLLDGFFGALRDGDFERASHYTAGPALQFVNTLAAQRECTLSVTDAGAEKPSLAKAGGKNLYQLFVKSTITLSSGVTQRFDSASIQQAKDGSWRLFDLLAGTLSIEHYVATPLAPEIKADKLRLVLVDVCYGPEHAHGTVDLTSSSEFAMPFVDAFLRLPNGDVVKPVNGLDALKDPIPPGGTRRFTFDFQRQALGPRASLVLVSLDALDIGYEAADSKSVGQPRERVYPMKVPRIFVESIST